MRIYSDPVEMLKEVERDLFEMGTRVGSATVQDKNVADDPAYEMIELFGYGYVLTRHDEASLKAMIELAGGSYEWAREEANDRVLPEWINPGTTWAMREDLWKPFLRDGRFAYTYNERLREQVPQVIDELRKRPSTRQAVVTMYDRHQDMGNWGGLDRVPCSMHYQFARRGGDLHCVYVMRSCDFATHFPHDVYFASRLQRHVAESTFAATGHLTHFVGSLHAFRKDLEGKGIF